jgi:hypothetical protein
MKPHANGKTMTAMRAMESPHDPMIPSIPAGPDPTALYVSIKRCPNPTVLRVEDIAHILGDTYKSSAV